MPDATLVLKALTEGDARAADPLMLLVYDELRRLAAQWLAREPPGQTLEPTALVHEAYLRRIRQDPEQRWDGRGHFFAAAAKSMRRILVENARRKQTGKRGGGMQRRELDAGTLPASQPDDEVLALDAALQKLAVHEPLKVKLVELRYFAGFTGDQAAAALGISPSAADRHWTYARAWLRREMRGRDAGHSTA